MTRNVLPYVFVTILMLSCFGTGGAQPWHWDFGSGVDSCTQGISTILLPPPPSGYARVRIGSQGGGVFLRNPGSPQLGAGTEIQLRAPTGGSLNKVQVHDFTGGSAFTIRCSIRIDSGPAVLYLFAGNGSCFDDNGGFTTAEIFTGVRFTVDSTGDIRIALRDAASWTTIRALTLHTGMVYDIELYCNNRSVTQTYTHDSLCTVGAHTLDFWINSVRVAAGKAKAGLPDTTAIDSFMFYGSDSPGNGCVLSFDDIHYENAIAAQPLPVELGMFRACVRGSVAELTWTTVTEINNHGFTVERRRESGQKWETRGFVPGLGTSAIPHTYRFLDSLPHVSGTHRYRLRQTDRDGTESISAEVRVTAVRPQRRFEAGIPYPLPAREIIYLPCLLTSDAPLSVRVYTLTGELVAEPFPRRLLPAGEHVLPLPCAAWPKGILICDIQSGHARRTRRLLLR